MISKSLRMLTKCGLTLILASMVSANSNARDTYRAHNTYSENIFLWIWPKTAERWDTNKPFIVRNGFEDVPMTDMGRHYLMTKDERGRERHLGWYTYSELFENVDPKELFLGRETRTRTETYSVSVPYTENVERTCRVRVPETRTRTVIRNGVSVTETYTVYKYVKGTRTVAVTKFRLEQRMKDVQYEIPTLSIRRRGVLQVVPGDIGKRTIGVSFRICPQGMHITGVKNGAPAQKCRDEAGRLHSLEPGDHIISIDGIPPTGDDQVKAIIGDSRMDIRIRVLDKDGVTIRNLTISPR